jgi:CheY-like chemotaxis protein
MPRLSAALVIDSDPKGLEALGYGLQVEGCRVTSAADLDGAVASIASSPPQLAIVVVRDPDAGGLAITRALATPRPSGVVLPVLVLGPESVRAEVKGIAGAAFLPLPAFVRDVATASKLILALHGAGMAAGAEDADIGGALSDYGLFYLMRTMAGLGRSGVVLLERGNRRGEVRFFAGQMTAAQSGSLQGSAALHHLLLWEQAGLELKLRSNTQRGPVLQRSEDFLGEAERFLRDFDHAARPIGPISTVLVAGAETAPLTAEVVPAEVVPVMSLFDGERTLGDVLEDSPFRVFDTVRIVARLLDSGMLRRKPDASAAEPAPRPPMDEWLHASSPPPTERPDSRSSTGKTTQPLAPILGQMRPVQPKDQRMGPLNRRRTHRRDRTTEEHLVLAREPAAALSGAPAPLVTSAPASPLATKARSTPPLGSRTLASSSLPPSPIFRASDPAAPTSAHGELRSSSTPVPGRRPVMEQPPSMVVDLALDPTPLPSASAPTAPVPAPLALAVSVPEPEPPSAAAGEVTARPLPATAGARPSGSIELDPALMEELTAIEMAAMPATPLPVVTAPPPAPRSAPHPVAPAASVTFAPAAPQAVLEPSPAPLPQTVTSPITADLHVPVVRNVQGTAPSGSQPPEGPGGRSLRGPPGEFDALERDFFAREADLYKQEPQDKFDDLDRRKP